MTYAYCRKPVSEVDNQSIAAVYGWAERYGLQIDKLFLETEEESKKTYENRKLGLNVLPVLKEGDYLILSEISCAGRSAVELDRLINNDLYHKKIKFVCLSMNVCIDFSDLSNEDRAFMNKITFASLLQTTIVKEYTSYALKSKIARGERIGGGSSKWRDSFNRKNAEQRAEESQQRGKLKTIRSLRKRDTYVFMKILKSVFPEATANGIINSWIWKDINTKKGKSYDIYSLMKQCKDVDHRLFVQTDFQDINSTKSQKRISSKIQHIRESLKRAEKIQENFTMDFLYDEKTIKSYDIKEELMVLLNCNFNYIKRKTNINEELSNEFKLESIRISSDSYSKFKEIK